jgi:hypothetical protein
MRVWGRALACVPQLVVLALPIASPVRTVAAGPATARFEAVGPVRLSDTREFDCGCAPIGPNTIRVKIGDRAAVSGPIVAAAITVTATNTVTDGYVTAYPAGAPRPDTSTLNAHAEHDASNSAIIPVGVDEAIDLFAQSSTDLVVDLTGVFVATSSSTVGRFQPAILTRLLDTRDGSPDGLSPFSTITVPLPPAVALDAVGLAVNITTVGERIPGFVRGYAAGSAPPATSFTNPDGSGRARAASVILPVSPLGLTVATTAGGHLIVDLLGWFTGPSAPESDAGLFVSVAPSRLLDTRTNGPRLWPTATREVASPVTGASALITNITLARPDDTGFMTAYPAGTDRPGTSSINAVARDEIAANLAVTPLSTRGVAYFSSAGTDLVVDLTGYFTGAPVLATLPVPPRVLANPRVLLIGDSTFGALNVIPASRTALRGFQPLLDLEPCRRLVRPSCQSAFTLRTPPTALETIRAAPPLIDIVVMRTGYNDGSVGFDTAVRAVLDAARAKAIRSVVWLTYSDGTGNQIDTYNLHNATLRTIAASGAYPELVVADWRTYAERSTDWYATDRVHLVRNGAWATADYVTRWINHLVGSPCPVPWRPDAPIVDPCPDPDESAAALGIAPDLRGLYGL